MDSAEKTAPTAEELEAQAKAEAEVQKRKEVLLAEYADVAVNRGASEFRAQDFAYERLEKMEKGEVETHISSDERDAMSKLFATERIAGNMAETLDALPVGTELIREPGHWKVKIRTDSTTHFGHGKTLCEALADAGR